LTEAQPADELIDDDQVAEAPIGASVAQIPEHGRCLWPIGDPGDPAFRWCGLSVTRPGRPYCRKHQARHRRLG
jgi:hypothetical protein